MFFSKNTNLLAIDELNYAIYLNKHTEIVSQKPLLNGVAINDSVWISAGKKIEEIIILIYS
jgi:hypothetical protein